MFIAALSYSKTGNNPKHTSTGEWVNKLWYIHIKEYYLAICRNELFIHATTLLNLKLTMLERKANPSHSPPQKTTHCIKPYLVNSRKCKVIYNEKSNQWLPRGERRAERGGKEE